MAYVIGVSHKKNDPRRVESLKRVPYDFVEDTPGHHSVWAPRMWRAALAAGTEHCVFLQDDVICHTRNFQPYCIDHIVCLHTPHPRFGGAFAAGCLWARSVDGLVGNGYILPRAILEEFLVFRASVFLPEVLKDLNEDAQISLFAMATDRRIWHPLPSPIDHDTSIPSTWGADHHANRRPCAPWEGVRGRTNGQIADVGRIYPAEHWRLLTHFRPEASGMVERAYVLSKL